MTAVWIILVILAIIVIVVLAFSFSRRRSEPADTSYQDALRALLDGREAEAMRYLRDVVMKDTDNVDAYIRLGRIIRERGDAEKASNIHQSLTVRPALKRSEELVIYEELVEDYLAMGRIEKSIGLMKELMRLSSDKLQYLRRLLSLLLSRKRTPEAAELLKRHEKLFHDKKEAALWNAELARLQWESNQEARALDSIKHAQRLAKDHPYVLLVQIRSFLNKDEKSKARALVEKFLKLYPQHAEKVLDLVEQIYFDLGVYEKVAPLYEDILKRYPDKREVLLRLAGLKIKEGSPDEALELIDSVLAENPDDLQMLVERIKLLLVQRKWEAATGSFSKIEEALLLLPVFCDECGQELGADDWFCPGCGTQVYEP